MIEYADLVGKPFQHGGRGLEAFDCYGLIMELYKRQGINIPDFRCKEDEQTIAALMQGNLSLWEECEEKEGAVVYFNIMGLPRHVGMYVGMGRFVHAWEKTNGVTVEKIYPWRKRIIGFYEYVGTN